jgi:SAM-dependent methyltransferase
MSNQARSIPANEFDEHSAPGRKSAMPNSLHYATDLAYVHDAGFTAFAKESAPGLLEVLRLASITEGLVVDLGCGSGIWAHKLVNAGYDVIGVDISPSFIETCRARVPTAEFHATSLFDFKLPQCRAVTALGEVLNYQHDRWNGANSLRHFFERVYSVLEPGGLFMFDVAEPARHGNLQRSFWEGNDWANLVEFKYDPAKQRLSRCIVTFRKVGEHYRRREETHVLQLYRGTEIAGMLRQIGFRVRVVRSYGDYRLPKAMAGFIARKARP